MNVVPCGAVATSFRVHLVRSSVVSAVFASSASLSARSASSLVIVMSVWLLMLLFPLSCVCLFFCCPPPTCSFVSVVLVFSASASARAPLSSIIFTVCPLFSFLPFSHSLVMMLLLLLFTTQAQFFKRRVFLQCFCQLLRSSRSNLVHCLPFCVILHHSLSFFFGLANDSSPSKPTLCLLEALCSAHGLRMNQSCFLCCLCLFSCFVVSSSEHCSLLSRSTKSVVFFLSALLSARAPSLLSGFAVCALLCFLCPVRSFFHLLSCKPVRFSSVSVVLVHSALLSA